MKTTRRLLGLVAGILGAVCSVQAQDSTVPVQTQTTPQPKYVSDTSYNADELSFDGFAGAALNEYNLEHGTLTKKHYRFAAGAGINYFITRYVGIGGDAYGVAPHSHSFVDTASGNLILRLPLGDTGIAPYIFGGGGYQFEGVNQTIEQAGGGFEFRLVQHLSLFVDARYVFADRTQNYGLGRAGIRISF